MLPLGKYEAHKSPKRLPNRPRFSEVVLSFELKPFFTDTRDTLECVFFLFLSISFSSNKKVKIQRVPKKIHVVLHSASLVRSAKTQG